MKILIVEDDQNKMRQMTTFLSSQKDVSKIVEARSYNSGMRELIKKEVDVVILDMSLPTFDTTVEESGGRPRSYAGKDILSQLVKKKIEVPSIVVTQFDYFGEGEGKTSLKELHSDLNRDFSVIYKGTVFYSASSDDWQQQLRELLNNVKEIL